MKGTTGTPHVSLASALEAIGNLANRELNEVFHSGLLAAQDAHDEIELAPINHKSGSFYRHLVPSRRNLVSVLARSYRRYFRLALAHSEETGNYPDQWTRQAIQPAISTTQEWLRDWFILACDGENQYVRKVASVPFTPGESVSIPLPLTAQPFPSPRSWRAPAWLFKVSPDLGILLLWSEHVPANDSEEKLSVAHTRLILKGARRAFLWDLEEHIETARDEEIAAAGAIPPEMVAPEVKGPKTQKGKRRRDKQRMLRDKTITDIDDVSDNIADFLRVMDERGVKPQPTWPGWPGTWLKAYKDPRLRKLIHQDKSRALSRILARNR